MSEVLSGTRSYKLLPKPQPGLLSTHTDRLTSNWLSLQQPQDPRLPVTVDLGLLILDDLAASEFGIALEPVRQLNTRICLKTLLLVIFSDPKKEIKTTRTSRAWWLVYPTYELWFYRHLLELGALSLLLILLPHVLFSSPVKSMEIFRFGSELDRVVVGTICALVRLAKFILTLAHRTNPRFLFELLLLPWLIRTSHHPGVNYLSELSFQRSAVRLPPMSTTRC